MAKRPSLVGTGRQALAAATGGKPAQPEIKREPDEAAPAPRPVRSTQRSVRVKPAPAPASKHPEAQPKFSVDTPAAPAARDMTSLYGELLAFGAEQMRHSLATAAALSRCQTPLEVFATQAQFARGTAARFGTQALKLMQLAGASSPHHWTLASVGTRRTGDRDKPK